MTRKIFSHTAPTSHTVLGLKSLGQYRISFGTSSPAVEADATGAGILMFSDPNAILHTVTVSPISGGVELLSGIRRFILPTPR